MKTPQLSLKAKKFLERNSTSVDSEPRQQTDHTPETLSQRIVQNWFAGHPNTGLERLADAAPALLEAAKTALLHAELSEATMEKLRAAIKLAQLTFMSRNTEPEGAATRKGQATLGERCAEKATDNIHHELRGCRMPHSRKDGYWKFVEREIAAIINQEVTKEKEHLHLNPLFGNETPPASEVVNQETGLAWMDKAARQIAAKGDNLAFWHGRVDFSAHEIKKIIQGCYNENRRAPLTAAPRKKF